MSPVSRPDVSRRDALVLAGLLGAGGAALLTLRATRPVGEPIPLSPTLEAVQAEQRPGWGPAGADLHLLLFTDYNCGACRRAHPEMTAAVVADGGVAIRSFDWPIFGDDSRAAARGALAADAQGLYRPVHEALMPGGRADGAAAEAALTAAGGSVARLRETLATEGERIDGMLARNAFHAFSLGLGGTPGHVIGRLLLRGAVSEREFRRAFDRARKLTESGTLKG
ncbi:disulfide bond formation protein DsbA [Sandaracinobacter neustonicus]|uniref:Disulfide bond formation protein DsbA n=1 Tax=Sandaracinobacter neustonicus TaxID=1715348 RepID=A0A501XWI2_9SPHN|nr:DsbA family protein [Sandaracinobacter neustonicus]TPE65058.1 disulfide bond formation protein DsbA [Sandaracinobacter neustonicus]